MNNVSELEYFKLGIAYYYGTNDFFEDKEKALEYFMNALDRGFKPALFYIAKINEDDGNIRSAIDYYMQGGQNGNFLCYAELGRIYISNDKYRNENNANKAWLLFFRYYCENCNAEESNYIDISNNELGWCSFNYLFYCCLNDFEIDTSYLYLMQSFKSEIQKNLDGIKHKITDEDFLCKVQSYIDMI